MVGRESVDRAVGQTRADGFDVAHRAQGRIDLVDRVVRGQQLVAETDVVRRRLGGDGEPCLTRLANQLHRAAGRHVGHVQARAFWVIHRPPLGP